MSFLFLGEKDKYIYIDLRFNILLNDLHCFIFRKLKLFYSIMRSIIFTEYCCIICNDNYVSIFIYYGKQKDLKICFIIKMMF